MHRANSSPSEVLKEAWRSPYYDHFHPPQIVHVQKRGKTVIMHKFVCKRCVVRMTSYLCVILIAL